MTVPTTEDEVDDAFREMDQYLSNPVTTISEFYTLMYLDEIKEVDEISFDYFDLKTTLDDVLYNYAVYVSAAELVHYGQKFRIDGIRAGEIANKHNFMTNRMRHYRREYNYSEERAEEEAEKELQERLDMLTQGINVATDNRKERGMVRSIMRQNTWPPGKGSSISGTREAIEKLVTQFSAFGRDSHFLEAAQTIFGTNWYSAMDAFDETGWSSSYGGRAWASVCETAQRKWDMGRTAFIDLMFSVEHNNGNFLNKWYTISEEDKEALGKAIQSKSQITSRAEDKSRLVKKANKRKIFSEAVPKLLTMARNENLGQLFEIAVQNNRNLRPYKSMMPNGDQRIDYEADNFVFH